MDSRDRVLARYQATTVAARRVVSYDAQTGITKFKIILDHLEQEAPKASKPDIGWTDQVVVGAAVRGAFTMALRIGIRSLFLHILANYDLNTKDRKVMERASKFFDKTTIRRIDPKKAVEVWTKHLAEYKAYYEVAKRVLSGNKREEGAATTLQAGPFTIVNTGGFDEKIMEVTAKLAEKAASLLTKKGLGKVCYGDILVTKNLTKSTHNLAFYTIGTDKMYVRADLKSKVGPALESLLHELGHRLQMRFMTSHKGIKEIYQKLSQETSDMIHNKDLWPPVGSEVKGQKGTYIVERYSVDGRYNPIMILRGKDNPNISAKYPIEGWLKNEKRTPFVSLYAATDADENFAEMIAHYCLGTLPDDQVKMLEAAL